MGFFRLSRTLGVLLLAIKPVVKVKINSTVESFYRNGIADAFDVSYNCITIFIPNNFVFSVTCTPVPELPTC